MRALITLGPTREHLDPVRFLSNGSSGRMGLALARELRRLGARPFLVCGPGIEVPAGQPFRRVISARDMLKAVRAGFGRCGLFIAAAAVADYRPVRTASRKLPKRRGPLSLRLVPNPDVLASVARKKGSRICVGFSLENAGAAALKKAREKMRRKNCDLMVLNHPQAMESGLIEASVLSADGEVLNLGRMTKEKCARKICQAIAPILSRKRSSNSRAD